MVKEKKNFFNFKISADTPPARLDTQSLYDDNYQEPQVNSALKMFFLNTEPLNVMANEKLEDKPQLSNLLVLGYISAVESYIREIIRKVVNIDVPSQKKCEDKSITYGAATTYTKPMLPEALLENCSFAGKGNIKNSLNNFLGISIQKSEAPDLEETLDDFSKVCQIRHCIVHRFGQIGSINAIEFGLEQHKKLVGKPIKLNFKTLQNIFLICNNAVKLLNNFLYLKVLARTVEREYEYLYNWSWDFENDKKLFKKYFDIFIGEEGCLSIEDAYMVFKESFYDTRGCK